MLLSMVKMSRPNLVRMDVNADSNEKDGDDAKIYDGMNQNREPTCMHVSKLHHSTSSRQLKQQPRRQQHKQHHRYQHWSPICHLSLSLVYLFMICVFMPFDLSFSLTLSIQDLYL